MTHAIELNPKNAPALNYLGYTYTEMGVKLEEAETLIRRALAIAPDDASTSTASLALYVRGDFTRAVEQLERAVELAGDDATIIEHSATPTSVSAIRATRCASIATRSDAPRRRRRSSG